jgi:hypothetical protein
MNFKQGVKHITGKKRFYRRDGYGALGWMERFIEAIPTKYSDDKKFLKHWFANKDDLDRSVADIYRSFFAQWKKEEISRSARYSGSCPPKSDRLKKESKDLIKTVIRDGQH